MLWPPLVTSQMVTVIGQGDAVALGGTRCLPPAASTADFTEAGLAPVSTQDALKVANRGGSGTCASVPAVRIAMVAIRIGSSLRICLTLRFASTLQGSRDDIFACVRHAAIGTGWPVSGTSALPRCTPRQVSGPSPRPRVIKDGTAYRAIPSFCKPVTADRLDSHCANQIAAVCGAEPPCLAIPERHNRHVGIIFTMILVQTQACDLREGIGVATLVPATADVHMVDNAVGAQIKSGGDLTRQ